MWIMIFDKLFIRSTIIKGVFPWKLLPHINQFKFLVMPIHIFIWISNHFLRFTKIMKARIHKIKLSIYLFQICQKNYGHRSLPSRCCIPHQSTAVLLNSSSDSLNRLQLSHLRRSTVFPARAHGVQSASPRKWSPGTNRLLSSRWPVWRAQSCICGWRKAISGPKVSKLICRRPSKAAARWGNFSRRSQKRRTTPTKVWKGFYALSLQVIFSGAQLPFLACMKGKLLTLARRTWVLIAPSGASATERELLSARPLRPKLLPLAQKLLALAVREPSINQSIKHVNDFLGYFLTHYVSISYGNIKRL